MHSIGIHSALAIKRQRNRRDEQRRARERRYSAQSSESGYTNHSPPGSRKQRYRNSNLLTAGNGMSDSKVVTSVGMLHIGVVFVVFGIFLLGAGLIPDDLSNFNGIGDIVWWNELICTGLFAVGLGVFLIILNCIISKREEDDLEDYVQRQLTRSRSGHRLERDVETGGLTTRHTRQAKMAGVFNGSGDNLSHSVTTQNSTEVVVTPTTPVGASGDMLLEKILEEESIYGDKDRCQVITSHNGSHDKRLLLGNGHNGAVNITRI